MSEKLKKALKRTNFDELNDKGYTVVKSSQKFNPDSSITKVVGPKFNPDTSITKVSKALKGTGKIAAIGAALGAAGNVMAGEKPDWETMGRGATEALIPAPVDAAFGSLANSDTLNKDDFKRMREESSRPAALEFGKRFAKALKTGKPI